MTIYSEPITSLHEYLDKIKVITKHWYFPTGMTPWFRGQSDASNPPLPGVFRRPAKEHDLTTFFIQRAGMYSTVPLPRSRAQYLSLMQHSGLPTRLLDWTESALVGLFFAVHSETSKDSAVWVLDAIELNKLSGITNLPASDDPPVSLREPLINPANMAHWRH
jgi:hypothetical protein